MSGIGTTGTRKAWNYRYKEEIEINQCYFSTLVSFKVQSHYFQIMFPGEILKLNPAFKAPADYKPVLKEEKVPIPVSGYPYPHVTSICYVSFVFWLHSKPSNPKLLTCVYGGWWKSVTQLYYIIMFYRTSLALLGNLPYNQRCLWTPYSSFSISYK